LVFYVQYGFHRTGICTGLNIQTFLVILHKNNLRSPGHEFQTAHKLRANVIWKIAVLCPQKKAP